jgi:hypothetical protein
MRYRDDYLESMKECRERLNDIILDIEDDNVESFQNIDGVLHDLIVSLKMLYKQRPMVEKNILFDFLK